MPQSDADKERMEAVWQRQRGDFLHGAALREIALARAWFKSGWLSAREAQDEPEPEISQSGHGWGATIENMSTDELRTIASGQSATMGALRREARVELERRARGTAGED